MQALAVVTAVATLIGAIPDARTQTLPACSAEPVSASGEPSRIVWLAKLKSRANWRRRVRATTGLGPDYADWSRASDAVERCITGPAGTACTNTAIPCR